MAESAALQWHGKQVRSIGVQTDRSVCNLAIIASSTGGPPVLRRIISGLSLSHTAIVIVQHIQPAACPLLCNSLNRLCPMGVNLVEPSTPIFSGSVYLAPAGYHTLISDDKLDIADGSDVNYCKPAADVAMKSVSPFYKGNLLGIQLSGLGRDGADGLIAMKQRGAITIAQRPETCAVRSMPDQAIATGCIDYILAPNEIKLALKRFDQLKK